MNIKPHCPICNGSEITEIGPYKNNSEIFNSLKLVNCISCDTVFANPMPDELLLTKYNSSYFMSAHGGHSEDITTVSFFKAIGSLRVNYVEKYLKDKAIKCNTVLEVGPGSGFFASIWMKKNPETEYYVLESDESCYDALHKVGVTILSSENLKETKERSFDLVIISHVLEHVSDPKSFLEFATKNLRIGGALFIEVPCRDYLHKDLTEPHLLFFDKLSMNYLLNQLSFNNIQLSYFGKKITKLKKASFLNKLYIKIRTKLISKGVVFPFSMKRDGMQSIENRIERAIISPFEAHIEQKEPSWWLRSISQKQK
jgi:ubiquinone/menaquinone biosynthesis C-methylase UbiE